MPRKKHQYETSVKELALNYVVQFPGSFPTEIAKDLNINKTNVMIALKDFEESNILKSIFANGHKNYFESDEKEILKYLPDAPENAQTAIVDYLSKHPNAHFVKMSEDLEKMFGIKINSPTLYWYLMLLENEGIVSSTDDTTRYSIPSASTE